MDNNEINGSTLIKLLRAYSGAIREQEMMYVYPEFFENFFDKLANADILQNLSQSDYASLIRSIGYLKFYCESVGQILRNKTRSTIDNTVLDCSWVEAVLDLRLHEDDD